MPGLIGTGQFQNEQSQQIFGQLAQREGERNQEDAQASAAKKTSVLGAVGTGAAIGTAIAPGVGTAIGAGVGLVAGLLF